MRTKQQPDPVQYAVVELGGIRYAILPESTLAAVCRKAGVRAVPAGSTAPSLLDAAAQDETDEPRVARRLADRRKRAGLTQVDLARRAGVRVETVNRIERGRVTPDFGTIRNLMQAMIHVETAVGSL